MAMFLAHVALSLGLMALVAGAAFLIWIKDRPGVTGIAKVMGYAVVTFSITGLLCTTYYAVRYWQDGYYRTPYAAQDSCMKQMMGSGKMNMMDGMMGGMVKDKMPSEGMEAPSKAPESQEVDHQKHH